MLRDFDVRCATDVSGFGLVGHLGEMLRGSAVGVELDAGRVPTLPGAAVQFERGVVSSLQANNAGALRDFQLRGLDPQTPALGLLVDPQTSGGLLASVSPTQSQACVAALRAAGYADAAVIGKVTDATHGWVIA